MLRSKIMKMIAGFFCFSLAMAGEGRAQDINHLLEQSEKQFEKQRQLLEKQMEKMEENFDAFHMQPSQLALDFEMPPIPFFDRFFNEFTGVKESQVVEQTWKVEGEKPLQLYGTYSEIAVVPGKVTDEIHASIEMIAGAGNEDRAKEILETMKVDFEDTKEVYRIGVPRVTNKEHEMGDVRVYKIKLRIPENLSALDIDNNFGDILLNDIDTDIICKNEFGSVQLKNVRGNAKIQNKFGSLDIDHHTGDGDYYVEYGGLTIEDYDGDLKLEVKFSQSSIQGLNEDVTLVGNFSFGATRIHLPKGFNGIVDAESNMGQIHAPASLNHEKEMLKQKVQGKLGEGAGRIKIGAEFSPVTLKVGNGGERKVEGKQPQVQCKGVVRDAETLKPVTNAKVVAYYLNQPPYAEARTDENGYYEFMIHSEEHLLKASAPEYQEDKHIVDTGFMQRKKSLKVDFVLDPE